MSDSVLRALIDHTISAAEQVHDYIQLHFDNGAILNIFNQYSLSGVDDLDIRLIVGKRVTEIREDTLNLEMRFGAVQLHVNLSEAAFSGPEAIEYISAEGDRIVWP
jgi:hypothetical protein